MCLLEEDQDVVFAAEQVIIVEHAQLGEKEPQLKIGY